MNNSKGFTMVEMMVAAGILMIAITGAMSFFIYQSQKGADSTRIRSARESLALALVLIQRDIMAAGYGVEGNKSLSFVSATYGIDKVTGNEYNSTLTTYKPAKLHVGFGTFLDMNFDVNGTNDTNSVFKYSASKDIGSAALATFVYDQFPIDMAVTTDTKPVGGFISSSGASDVNWYTSGSKPRGTKSWTVRLQSGMPAGTPSSFRNTQAGKVAPSIVYRIAQDFAHSYVKPGVIEPTYELQRNGMRIAGGEPGLEVYNLTVVDESGANKRRFSIRIDYQVKLWGSKDENASHGAAKISWHKGFVTISADPRVIVLGGG